MSYLTCTLACAKTTLNRIKSIQCVFNYEHSLNIRLKKTFKWHIDKVMFFCQEVKSFRKKPITTSMNYSNS